MKRLAALVLLLLGCNSTGELFVVLDSDLDPAQYGKLALTAQSAGGSVYERSFLLPAEATLPASLSLRARSGEPEVTIDAQLFAADATTLLVERKAELSFVHDQSLELELRLDSACVDHQCPDDQTCIEGQCKSDAVSADMLTHTGSGAIGGPHDGGVELDLSAGPTQAQDMSHGTQDMPHGTPDLAGCLPVPPPPANANMMGCTYFDFSTTHWMSLGPQITQPTASVTYDQQCPYLHIHMEQGKHIPGAGLVLITPSTGMTASWELQAGYNYQSDGWGFAGLFASAADGGWWEAGTTNHTSSGDSEFERNNTDDPTKLDRDDANETAQLTIDIQSSPSGGGTDFQYTVGQYMGDVPEPAIGPTQASFFVGNEPDPTGGTPQSNQIDVELAWLLYCPK